MDIVQLLFSIRGRISRKLYWIGILPLIIGYAIADIMTDSTHETIVGLGYLVIIALIWPSLAVQIKRWHDRDKSGWWYLICIVPIVGPIWAFIELGFLRGTSGPNRFDLSADSRPSYDYPVPTSPAKNPYLAEGSPKIMDSSPVRNAWRSQ